MAKKENLVVKTDDQLATQLTELKREQFNLRMQAATGQGAKPDQHGKVRLMVICLAVFLVGSIGAIFAWNIGVLIAFRALAGAGGAVFPLSYGIIRDEFPPEKVGVAIGLVSAVFGIGGGFGIVLSGIIVDNLSWRWLFIVGAVGIAIAVVLVHRYVPESPVKTPSRIDFAGAALLSVGLVALLATAWRVGASG